VCEVYRGSSGSCEAAAAAAAARECKAREEGEGLDSLGGALEAETCNCYRESVLLCEGKRREQRQVELAWDLEPSL
jgi:hypothetical protein